MKSIRVYSDNGHPVIEAFGKVIKGFDSYVIQGTGDGVSVSLSTRLSDIGPKSPIAHSFEIELPEYPTPEFKVDQDEHADLDEWGDSKSDDAAD